MKTFIHLLALAAFSSHAAGATHDLAAKLRLWLRDNPQIVMQIGRRVYLNETGGRSELLVTWLPGEEHASLGLGHFIWYPPGRDGPYRESFADLLAFLARRGVALPSWLSPAAPCPWPTREALIAAAREPKRRALERFLAASSGLQVEFMAERLLEALPLLLVAPAPARPAAVRLQLERVLRGRGGEISAAGLYALIDYVSFKGEGLDPRERHRGEGWGLLQVLQAMASIPGDGRAAFAEAAASVLQRRVENAPPKRGEGRWLPGWLKRVATYAAPWSEDPPARPGPA